MCHLTITCEPLLESVVLDALQHGNNGSSLPCCATYYTCFPGGKQELGEQSTAAFACA